MFNLTECVNAFVKPASSYFVSFIRRQFHLSTHEYHHIDFTQQRVQIWSIFTKLFIFQKWIILSDADIIRDTFECYLSKKLYC